MLIFGIPIIVVALIVGALGVHWSISGTEKGRQGPTKFGIGLMLLSLILLAIGVLAIRAS